MGCWRFICWTKIVAWVSSVQWNNECVCVMKKQWRCLRCFRCFIRSVFSFRFRRPFDSSHWCLWFVNLSEDRVKWKPAYTQAQWHRFKSGSNVISTEHSIHDAVCAMPNNNLSSSVQFSTQIRSVFERVRRKCMCDLYTHNHTCPSRYTLVGVFILRRTICLHVEWVFRQWWIRTEAKRIAKQITVQKYPGVIRHTTKTRIYRYSEEESRTEKRIEKIETTKKSKE